MHNKGKHKQDEKTTLRMGENICKLSKLSNYLNYQIFANEATDYSAKEQRKQRIILQNLQGAHAAQYQKNKQPNPKMGRRPK